jgi:hypothetical protein
MNDVISTSYIYDYNLDEFHFGGEALVEQYDPHCKPALTISSVYMDGKELPKPLQSDWLIDTLENHVLNLWTLEQRSKA